MTLPMSPHAEICLLAIHRGKVQEIILPHSARSNGKEESKSRAKCLEPREPIKFMKTQHVS
jgi:hypothetical protein